MSYANLDVVCRMESLFLLSSTSRRANSKWPRSVRSRISFRFIAPSFLSFLSSSSLFLMILQLFSRFFPRPLPLFWIIFLFSFISFSSFFSAPFMILLSPPLLFLRFLMVFAFCSRLSISRRSFFPLISSLAFLTRPHPLSYRNCLHDSRQNKTASSRPLNNNTIIVIVINNNSKQQALQRAGRRGGRVGSRALCVSFCLLAMMSTLACCMLLLCFSLSAFRLCFFACIFHPCFIRSSIHSLLLLCLSCTVHHYLHSFPPALVVSSASCISSFCLRIFSSSFFCPSSFISSLCVPCWAVFFFLLLLLFMYISYLLAWSTSLFPFSPPIILLDFSCSAYLYFDSRFDWLHFLCVHLLALIFSSCMLHFCFFLSVFCSCSVQ